ncbi:MAG TPA: HNH endonuclease signature motif containing protein [Ramlibacter sp.]|uniref:HNH endonuclease n=1 Tax=Ramlibacter sp. TaxID=1917967 RepID=UPI002B5896E0|nr:HNH endonuclease signature motif containing protein [Ramlibacter sp.]HVZ44598.1 HNH endonuclease signature motif containing protein [Ramlibacter sp.]
MARFGGIVEAIGGLVFLGVIYALWQYVKFLWEEWSGALGRWRRGEPLRASALSSQRYQEERARQEKEKSDLRRAHARDSTLILDRRFRARFKLHGLHEEVRAGVYNRYNNTCAACGKQPKRRGLGGLHIDHIKPVSAYPELEFVEWNLQLLCASCNRHKHDYDGDDWKEVTLARKKAASKRKRAARQRAS